MGSTITIPETAVRKISVWGVPTGGFDALLGTQPRGAACGGDAG